MTNEEILAEIERIKADLPYDSDLRGVMLALAMNLSLLAEIRCLMKGLVEAQRLGRWGEMTITGPLPEFPDQSLTGCKPT